MTTITARLEPEFTTFIAQYQIKHQLENRTEVIRQALRALQTLERREILRNGYRQMKAENETENNDAWLDSGLNETLDEATT
jgi:Arc/MetJ-type ribon-helix-helix transcriptional regulator